ncbi:ead/Ea22-like family protein [Raoultella ornithinolytica]|uniref:ead/Ea22-like family protein n=1 Tax=Raoultella ornithinolytica TaxID=54291 RepID=UPI00389C150A
MTTDITELAQSLKAAAEKATPGPWGVARDSKTLVSNQSHPIATVSDAMHRMLADGSTGKDAEFIALANPANIRALVEALEKAQQRIAELESRTVTAAAADVLAERQRQVAAEGWTAERDDSYQNSELADAAACYAIHAHNQGFSTPAHWPWSTTWWKQTNPRRDLVKAGALILAEIERIDRAAGIKVEVE